ncbi:hypothetical protein RIF29_29956 [Crotalaria pallida]|uniref:Uncharacterized protein n=1 Tax=Crotalaria pallida TaxID=3830 RepID=A0AAN9EHL1_CROPI
MNGKIDLLLFWSTQDCVLDQDLCLGELGGINVELIWHGTCKGHSPLFGLAQGDPGRSVDWPSCIDLGDSKWNWCSPTTSIILSATPLLQQLNSHLKVFQPSKSLILSLEDKVEILRRSVKGSIEVMYKLSEENRKRASNQQYKYRGSRAGYRGIEEDRLIAIRKDPSVPSIDPDTLSVEGQLNKNGEIDNPTTQEAIGRKKTQDHDSNAFLSKALNRPEHFSRLLGVGLGVSRKTFLLPQKRARRPEGKI